MAYDTPIPGYKTETVGNLRLWDALPVNEFVLEEFNKGNYVQARSNPVQTKPGPRACILAEPRSLSWHGERSC